MLAPRLNQPTFCNFPVVHRLVVPLLNSCYLYPSKSMASETCLRAKNGKGDALYHSNLFSVSTDPPRRSQSVSPMQEDGVPSSSPSHAAHRAAPLSSMDSRNLSLIPYVPSIAAQLRSAFEAKATMNGNYSAAAEGDLDLEEDRKRDREHKKRSKNWTRQETLMLIRHRTGLAPRFAMIGRKSELWDEIAEALQKERFCRDAQQCRDKWEKLMAGYKEVRDGLKERRDNPFFDELHPLLSGRPTKREKEKESSSFRLENGPEVEGYQAGADAGADADTDTTVKEEKEVSTKTNSRDDAPEEEDSVPEERVSSLRKRKRGPKFVAVTDLHAVQALLETILSRQQRYFKDLLDAMERREQLREQMRQEREEKWKAEERAQRCIFNNAMLVLTQKLVGERVGVPPTGLSGSLVSSPIGHQGPKKRSKNWKRAEVLQLIKLRGEMQSKFAKSTRRAALWEELAELLGAQGIKRDGKQCREKWDKLMSEYKDVLDGKREQGDSPYFAELATIVGGRPEEAG